MVRAECPGIKAYKRNIPRRVVFHLKEVETYLIIADSSLLLFTIETNLNLGTKV
jgi:hypothetical protein